MENRDLTTLCKRQTRDFPLARDNFKAMEGIVYRDILFLGFRLRLQYNPARMISTNACTDPAVLQRRPCFLCPAHRPAEQEGLAYGDRYHIFINPYPIFREHFTVPSDEHAPQLIAGRFADLLSLARDFPAYTVFYNGPASGASAPDHFHFQIAPRHIMPLEADAEDGFVKQETILSGEGYSVSRLRDYLRETIVVRASDRNLLVRLFEEVQQAIGDTVAYEQEPRLNLVAWHTGKEWYVCIFPRKQWRPRQFFLEGEGKAMFSPGCVDMAGLIITPRREDFDHYTPELLKDMFAQVSISGEESDLIVRKIQNANTCKHLK